ncbi:MAG: TlpA disulfide reductase family protein [Gammaproteobacteria bacterium]|nr:TlpA disulfide reductase family protein [Gammaproteobacteria bacterium]
MTDRTFLDALNNERKLSDFGGKPLIVHFWGTWCPPCIKEMPALDRFQKKSLTKSWKFSQSIVTVAKQTVRSIFM